MYTRICPDWRKQHAGKTIVLYKGDEHPGKEVVKTGICSVCLTVVLGEFKIWAPNRRNGRLL